jgi:hypothetical protein
LDANTISKTAPPARRSSVPVLIPPPILASNELAAVLPAGVVIVVPPEVYVVVGAITREPICVQEFSSVFSSFCQLDPVFVFREPEEPEGVGKFWTIVPSAVTVY